MLFCIAIANVSLIVKYTTLAKIYRAIYLTPIQGHNKTFENFGVMYTWVTLVHSNKIDTFYVIRCNNNKLDEFYMAGVLWNGPDVIQGSRETVEALKAKVILPPTTCIYLQW